MNQVNHMRDSANKDFNGDHVSTKEIILGTIGFACLFLLIVYVLPLIYYAFTATPK